MDLLESTVRKHINDFKESEDQFTKIIEAQIGASVPEFFNALKTAVVNPSNVGIGILDRMIDTDDTISAAMEFKVLMMLSRVGEYYHKDEKIRKFVTKFIKEMKGPTWEQALEGMASGCGLGFSVSEINWKVNDDYQVVPRNIITYHPSTICFEMDREGITEDGIIQFVTQYNQGTNPNKIYPTDRYGWSSSAFYETPMDRLMPLRVPYINNFGIVRIPRKKVVHYVYRAGRSFGSPYGKTPVRTAHMLWQLKNFFLKQVGIAGDKASFPLLVAKADKASHMVEYKDSNGVTRKMSVREALIEMLREIKSKDHIVVGKEDVIEKIDNMVQLSNFTDVVKHLDVAIFRCFLIPSLVMTDGSAGSRALGDKHFEIVGHIADVDARSFTQSIINDLIQPAIEKNFGPQEEYGEFQKRHQSLEEFERLANVFAQLDTTGFVDSTIQEDFDLVRKNLSLPERKIAEPVFPNIEDDELDAGEITAEDPEEVSNSEIIENSLNGAQIASMAQVVSQVASMEIPLESGIEILMKAFNITREEAQKIISSAGSSFKPNEDEPLNE